MAAERGGGGSRSGRRWWGRRIPVVRQMNDSECAAACLAMTLKYHGRHLTIYAVRELLGSGRDGTDAAALLAAAQELGLRGRGVALDASAVGCLPAGSILHWGARHFVVFERMRGDAVEIVDPALGRLRVTAGELRAMFSGVALLLEPGEGFTRCRSPRSRVWHQLLQGILRSPELPQVLALSAVLQAVAMGLPFMTGALVDRVVPSGERSLLELIGIGAAALVLFYLATSVIRSVLLLHIRRALEAAMTTAFVGRLMALPYGFFQRRSSGDLLARVNSCAVIREIFTYGTLSSFIDGILVLVFLGLLFWADMVLAGLVCLLAVLQLAVFLVTRRRLGELASEGLRRQSLSDSFLVEMVSGVEALKVMGAELRSVTHWTQLFGGVLNSTLRRARLRAVSDCVVSALYMACPFVVLGYGGLLVLRGQLTLGAMLSLNALAGGLLGPLSRLTAAASQFQLLDSYIERIDDVMQSSPEHGPERSLSAPRLQGRVQLKGATFRYGPRSMDVVQDVSLDIEPGQCVAVVGASGSGKSTLASLIVGLYPTTAGQVLLDGLDLGRLDLQSVRGQLGFVPQRPYLFGMTIRDNIALGNSAMSLAEVERAAKLACVHDEIVAMPLAYDTPLSEGGSSVSGGQRQRIALARALANQPRVLVLDEATSALDAVTEMQVLSSLARYSGTRIIIAHRLSTVKDADRIVVLEAGRVAESGSHAELMRRNGRYRALVAAQLSSEPVPVGVDVPDASPVGLEGRP